MTPEAQDVKRKPPWRDEHMDCICGFANGQGGVLEIGRNAAGEAVGVADILDLLDEIPSKVQSLLGLVVNVDLKSDCGRDYLRIVVPSHPTPISYRREFPYPATALPADVAAQLDGSTRKQPENHVDQPENSQKTPDRIVAFLRKSPEASRRDIVVALGNTTEGSVRYQLDKLKAAGRLRRVGPDKGGHWMVADGPDADGTEETDAWAGDHRGPAEPQPGEYQRTSRKPPENNQKTTRNDHPPLAPPLTDRILALLRQNPTASRREIAATLRTTESTVRYRLDKLRVAGKIIRVGPDKGGQWKVLDDSTTEHDLGSVQDPRSPR